MSQVTILSIEDITEDMKFNFSIENNMIEDMELLREFKERNVNRNVNKKVSFKIDFDEGSVNTIEDLSKYHVSLTEYYNTYSENIGDNGDIRNNGDIRKDIRDNGDIRNNGDISNNELNEERGIEQIDEIDEIDEMDNFEELN